MKKTTELIVGIVSLVLIAAMALGVFSVLKSIDIPEEDDKATEETVKDTSSDSGGDDSTDATQAATVPPTGGSASSFYISSAAPIGYIVNGDTVSFFAIATAPQDMNINEPGGCYDVWAFQVDRWATCTHVTYDIPGKYSVDGGLTWIDMHADYESGDYLLYDPDVYVYNQTFFSNNQSVYIQIATSQDLSDLNSRLTAIVDNMLTLEESKECRCEGTYYSLFWTAYHKGIPTSDSDSGVLG